MQMWQSKIRMNQPRRETEERDMFDWDFFSKSE